MPTHGGGGFGGGGRGGGGFGGGRPAEDSAEEDRRWEDGPRWAAQDRRAVQDFSGDLDGASVRDIAAAVFPLSWYL